MRWRTYPEVWIPLGSFRVIRRFALFPIRFKLENDKFGGIEWRWLEIVFIKQKYELSARGFTQWSSVSFSSKLNWLNS